LHSKSDPWLRPRDLLRKSPGPPPPPSAGVHPRNAPIGVLGAEPLGEGVAEALGAGA
jgi:hypothetical protein